MTIVPISVTLVGIVTDANDEHDWKVPPPGDNDVNDDSSSSSSDTDSNSYDDNDTDSSNTSRNSNRRQCFTFIEGILAWW